MDAVAIVSCAVWRCVDTFVLLVELSAWLAGCLLHLLANAGTALHGTLLALSGSSFLEYCKVALFSFLSLTEVASSAAHGALRALQGALQTLGGVCEGFKMAGHLLCHVAWRTKELLQRGLLSGNLLMRQMCEGVCIALSLIFYFVNTVVNIVLIAMQDCVSVLVGPWEPYWEVMWSPLHKALELGVTALTFLYGCLVGVSVLLRAPCQLLLEALASTGRLLLLLLDNGLLLLFLLLLLGLLSLACLMNPGLRLAVARWCRQRGDARPGGAARLLWSYCAALLERRASRVEGEEEGVQDSWSSSGRGPVSGVADTDTTDPPTTPPTDEPSGLNETPPEPRLLPHHAGGSSQSNGDGGSGSPSVARRTNRNARQSTAAASVAEGSDNALGGDIGPGREMDAGGLLKEEEEERSGRLLGLLKEQEERKKCVICQDRCKSVLLLPCRHLCLCRLCADILVKRRPLVQRCCPLCRQPIAQTMDVFL